MRKFPVLVLLMLAGTAAAEPEYGTPRMMEAGGSAGLTVATESRDFNVSPQIGFFVERNLELSGILSVSRVATAMDSTSFSVTALAEPSYHVPITHGVFGFFGVGVGGAWVQDDGFGVAIAPRLGTNFRVGGSGLITPALSWQYATIGSASQLRVNLGYTVLW